MPLDIFSIGAWVWDTYGKDLAAKVKGQAQKDWEQFRWLDAAKKYHARLLELHSEMRVLGKSKPVSVEGIFTEVYVLDRLTAARRFDLEELKKAPAQTSFPSKEFKRLKAVDLAQQQDRLFILGKPGAGKTTFLKNLTLLALNNQIEKVPIFIALPEWARSGLALDAFMARQFEICNFPDAALFIDYLLTNGLALVLFDGLDEVNEADDQRVQTTTAINDFSRQYRQNKIFITCRIAASNYAFDGFTDVEVADFNTEQVETFAQKWFQENSDQGQNFIAELKKETHRGLRELAQTPLLLVLLCLNFEETLTFPPRRAEIYEEALDALLKKLDSSRNIRRDELYMALSLGRKRQLFAQIAAEYFEKGEVFFRQADLVGRIEAFMRKLPASEAGSASDGEAILKAIEAQHGLFVERARGIYSFSHLSLQEYFTARYVVDNAAQGVLERLIDTHLTDPRWREVFLLTASTLSDADSFLGYFRKALDKLILDDPKLLDLLSWAVAKAPDYSYIRRPAVARAAALDLADLYSRDFNLFLGLSISFLLVRPANPAAPGLDLNLALELARRLDKTFAHEIDRTLAKVLDQSDPQNRRSASEQDQARALVRNFMLDQALVEDLTFAFAFFRDLATLRNPYFALARNQYNPLTESKKVASDLNLPTLVQALKVLPIPKPDAPLSDWLTFAEALRQIMISHRNLGHNWQLTNEQQIRLSQYKTATLLLAECLQLAAIANRKEIEESLFLPLIAES